jgi:hypothetical protein
MLRAGNGGAASGGIAGGGVHSGAAAASAPESAASVDGLDGLVVLFIALGV